jgi:hypothetical protein
MADNLIVQVAPSIVLTERFVASFTELQRVEPTDRAC